MPDACRDCLRRSWLLGELSAVLDRNCRADGRLFDLLELDDERLIAALGGRRRPELERRHARFRERDVRLPAKVSAICVHSERYPNPLRYAGGPRLLHVSGGLDRLHALLGGPTVALLGTRDASDYGLGAAQALARELAASGVALVTERRAGIALAAQEGALQAAGATVSIAGEGLSVPPARARRPTYDRLASAGCVVSELPDATNGRSWGTAVAVRIASALGEVTVVVEADDRPQELRGARLAQALGRPLAALPGPVGSRTSAGCHLLLREGARLVRDAADVLDLLYGVDEGRAAARVPSIRLPRLRPDQRDLLKRVGEGTNTLGQLTAGRRERAKVLRDLSELELIGLLRRGTGGRYMLDETGSRPPLRYGCGAQMES